MPSGILATGAGAAGGLEELLARMLAEDKFHESQSQFKQEQGEKVRSNQADESLRRDTLGENVKQRQLQQAQLDASKKASQDSLDQSRKAADADRDDSRALQSFDRVPGGTELPANSPDVAAWQRANLGSRLEPKLSLRSTEMLGSGDGLELGKLKMRSVEPQVNRFKKLSSAAEEKTAAEIATRPDTSDNMTDGSYNLPGVGDIVAQRNKQGRILYKGKDVTDSVKPYQAPDRVLVQSGDSYIPRTEAVGKPLATTSSTRTMGEGAKMLKPHITETQSLATDLDKRGLFGPVMSRVRQALTKAGSIDEFSTLIGEDPDINNDREAGKFATMLGLLATGAGRVHGGARGGGSPQMYQHFKSMLSDASSLQMFLGRLDALDSFMTGYANGQGGEKGALAPSAGGGQTIDVGGFKVRVKQ